MSSDGDILYEFMPFLRQYKSGRVERYIGTQTSPPGTDESTGVVSKDVTLDASTGLAARLFRPGNVAPGQKLPILVYFHGGAFVIASPFSTLYHRYASMLAAAHPLVVVSVDYRLAPEAPIPAAYDDAFAALNWAASNAASGPESFLSEHGDALHLFVAGDSAGGNIAHNAVMRAGREGLQGGAEVAAMALVNAYFWGKEPVGREPTDAAVRERMESTWGFVTGWRYGVNHPYANPMAVAVEEWRRLGCRRVLVTVATADNMAARELAYAEKLRGSGWEGEVEVHEVEGEDHCFHLWTLGTEKSNREMARLLEFFRKSEAPAS